MESTKDQDLKIEFNNAVLNDTNDGRKITSYTWIYRWEDETEFQITAQEDVLHPANDAIRFKKKEAHKYLQNIFENRPYIII